MKTHLRTLFPALDETTIDAWLGVVEPLADETIRTLAAATRWARLAAILADRPERDWFDAIVAREALPADAVRRAVARAAASATTGLPRAQRLCSDLLRLQRNRRTLLETPDATTFRSAVVSDTARAWAALDALDDVPADALTRRVRAALPQLAALAHTHDRHAAVEHQAGASTSPLLAHTMRALERLAALEGDTGDFDPSGALGDAPLTALRAHTRALEDAGLLDAVRAALVHLDVAKGGDADTRARWAEAGIELGIHNEAAAEILDREQVPLRDDWHADDARRGHWALVRALVAAHGLAGQALRGETPWAVLADAVRPVFAAVHASVPADRAPADRDGLAAAALLVVNVADTGAVRDGLIDDGLAAGMRALHDALADRARASEPGPLATIAAAACAAHPVPGVARTGDGLLDRFARLRRGRIDAGESPEHLERVLAGLDRGTRATLVAALERTQLWYVEAATGALSPASQVKLVALGLGAARTADAEHVTFQPLLPSANAGDGHRYRRRLLEVLLENVEIASLLERGPAAVAIGDLGAFEAALGGSRAVSVYFDESPEASALMTLLPIYEGRSSATFHSTLKALCDVYGLRKDEFDRVANEAQYLVHMNSARSDKARMVDRCVPGTIVEVGPGGGIVLDLLEDAFPDSRVVGIDVSKMVVEALERRRQADGRRWEIIEADAFAMPDLMGAASVDTVVYCSVLHEIFSYVTYPDPATGSPRPYNLASVRALLEASWTTLKTGGRIVIRDGIAPPSRPVIVSLEAEDARPCLELFAREFVARPIHFEDIAGAEGRRVRMDAADAMEFLYCYTWGPESFPYEVREQYGVLTYADYRAALLEWLAAVDPIHAPRWVELPAAEQSYLQPGYDEGLAGRAAVFELDGTPAPLPDSNCLLVVEKVARTP